MKTVTEGRLRRLRRAIAPHRWKPRGLQRARIFRNEEKGSDVNLASYLLLDAFRDEYDFAVVLSNDSDLAEPIRLVRSELGKAVWVISPHTRISRLGRVATRTEALDRALLPLCQFPETVRLPNGRSVHRSAEWV